MPMKDPIVEETREARRQLDIEFGGDLNLLYAYFCAVEHQNADRVVRLQPRPAVTAQRQIT
jgi:hypothetical protein